MPTWSELWAAPATNAENRLKKQNADQEMLFRQLYAKHVVKEPVSDAAGKVVARVGDLNTSGFIKDAAEAGLSRDYINKYLDQDKLQANTNVELATQDQVLGTLGRDYKAATRAGSQYGEPDPISVPNEEYKGNKLEPATAPKARNGQSLSGALPSRNFNLGFSGKKTTEAVSPIMAKNGQSLEDALGMAPKTAPSAISGYPADDTTINIKSFPSMQAPIDSTPPTKLAPGVDNRTSIDAVRDSYMAPTNGMTVDIGQGSAGFINDFDYSKVQDVGGVQLKTGVDSAIRKVGLEPGQASVNAIINRYMSAVPRPGAQFTENKYDLGKTMQYQREYPAKLAEAKNRAINDLSSGNTTAIGEVMSARGQELARVNQANEVIEKNAAAAGSNTFADKITGIGNKVGLPGSISPTSFKSKDEMDAFGKQATAYAQMQEMVKKMPEGGFKDPVEIVNFSKNFTQAEGLGEAEGTRNLIAALSVRDPAARAIITTAMGQGPQFIGNAITTVLSQYRPADLTELAKSMKFVKDWQTHTSTAKQPMLQTYVNPGETQPTVSSEVAPINAPVSAPASPSASQDGKKPFTWDDFKAYMESQKVKADKGKPGKPKVKSRRGDL